MSTTLSAIMSRNTTPADRTEPETMTTRSRAVRRVRVLAGGAVAAVALVVGFPASAHAHVDASADTTAAGAMARLTLAVPHGCEGSPTTRIEMALPAGVNEVVPAVDGNWKVSKHAEPLAVPITRSDGSVLTERTASVVWVARSPLPDGIRALLSIQLQIPADAAGQRLAFPVVQTCAEGSTDWTQVAGEGVDPEELELPAPSIVVTEGSGGGPDSTDTTAATSAVETTGPVEVADASVADTTAAAAAEVEFATAPTHGPGAATVVVLLIALIGLAAGIVALGRSGRLRPRPRG